MCIIPFLFRNSLNSADVNCGSSFDTSCIGRLYLLNRSLKILIVSMDVSGDISYRIAGNFHETKVLRMAPKMTIHG